MRSAEAIVIGGGQAGLAMSRALTDRGIEHVVLERGRIAERWRSERWASLQMLTPRWMNRLPGWSYRGPDPNGFMDRDELVTFLDDYAASFRAPVECGVTVTSVARDGTGYRVATTRGDWWAPHVVIATGHCDLPLVPGIASALDPNVSQIVSSRYRRADLLREGGVLIVGASSTGVQLAAEIQASGRPVTLSVGRHTRLPRRYRGHDIMAWLDAMGVLNQRADQVPNLATSRRAPSLQLIGSANRRSIDLGTLQAMGVRLAGRAVRSEGRRMHFADDLAAHIGRADERLRRQMAAIDAHIRARGLDPALPSVEPMAPVPVPDAPRTIDLGAEEIRTVIWATGYRRSYPWLNVPVLDPRGEIRQTGGVTPAPGVYALGLFFQTRRNSSFIDGVGIDARAIARHMASSMRSHTVSVPHPEVRK
jgi:putative flavoprotein involved in K+ transport